MTGIYDTIWEKITNVKWSKWPSPIAKSGIDIWNYKIDVPTSSHSILKIIATIEKFDRLVKRKIDTNIDVK
ncbi:MAG: hypothetical protein ACD_3C00192G0007 [uncultured bacterium (gcode 4)]|uniref:Uncharacterized protein n=1 Tax=uncultured bacterium (gcode 4) TaxID=1234023 RepID=K2G078_9BACT|nr:MAG: hypothetical protein ACD_3C00192G0007 [uncultured bacterium (gcode 4)]